MLAPSIGSLAYLWTLLAFAPKVAAYYYGAGACPGGEPAVGLPHYVNGGVSQSQINGTLDRGNLTVLLDSVPLIPGTPRNFTIGVNHLITLKRSNGSYKGLLIRLAGYGTQALSYQKDDANLQIAAVCITHYPNPVSGVTHTNNDLKNETKAILRVDAVANKLPLDVTVVIRNNGVSEFYYSGFMLSAVNASTAVPVPTPVASTTSAPFPSTTKPSGPPTAVHVKIPAGYCFSGLNKVEVQGKGSLFMKDLKIGDVVRGAHGRFDRVYSFGHYQPNAKFVYLQIHSEGLSKPLEISEDHLLFVNNITAPASTVKIGDKLRLGMGRGAAKVVKINYVARIGAFAPFTVSGTIMVNGFAASTYVSLQKDSNVLVIGKFKTGLTWHWLAHVFEAPHRLFCKLRMDLCRKETYTKEGISQWVSRPLDVSQWLLRQQWPVVTALLTPALLLWLIFYISETCAWCTASLAFVVAAPFMAATVRWFVAEVKSKSA